MGRNKEFFWLFVCVKSFACDMFMFVGYWIEHYMRSTQVSQIHQENCSFIVKMRNGSANLFEFIVFMFHRKSLALVTHMLDSINKIREINIVINICMYFWYSLISSIIFYCHVFISAFIEYILFKFQLSFYILPEILGQKVLYFNMKYSNSRISIFCGSRK